MKEFKEKKFNGTQIFVCFVPQLEMEENVLVANINSDSTLFILEYTIDTVKLKVYSRICSFELYFYTIHCSCPLDKLDERLVGHFDQRYVFKKNIYILSAT